MAVRLSRGEHASRRNSNFFFPDISLPQKQTSLLVARLFTRIFREIRIILFLYPERNLDVQWRPSCLLSAEIRNKSANRLPFVNRDNEICQRIHYLDRSFKSYIAIAERSNREHRTHLLLSLFFFLEKMKTGIILVDDTNLEQLFPRFYPNRDSGRFQRRDRKFFPLVCDGKFEFVEITHGCQSRQDFASQAAWRPALLVEFKYGADNDYETREGQTRENGHGITRCHTYTRDINMRVRNTATRGRTRGENYIR